MTTQTYPAVPEVDARGLHSITQEHARAFEQAGLLILRGVLAGEELDRLRAETAGLVDRAVSRDPSLTDVVRREHEITGEEVPFRVEYVVDKLSACRALLGHPFLLRSVEVLQGRSFIPTWDSMVFKKEGAGVAIPWHRDSAASSRIPGAAPIFNVDVYLDVADETNCLWGLPGSNTWDDERARQEVDRRNTDGFVSEGAVPLPMQPGDVLIHDILAIHGSPPARSALRRVLYYEFRPAAVEAEVGPHVPEYIPLKQQVLAACLAHRSEVSYARGEDPYEYRPEPPFEADPGFDHSSLETLRYPHRDWWRGTR